MKPSEPAASDSGDNQPSIITSVVVIKFIARLVRTIGQQSAKVATISRRKRAPAPEAVDMANGVMVSRAPDAPHSSADHDAHGLGHRMAQDRVLIGFEMDAVEVGAGDELPRIDESDALALGDLSVARRQMS